MALSNARITESEPGSQPAEIIAAALLALAIGSYCWLSDQMSVWISKLSTLQMPFANN